MINKKNTIWKPMFFVFLTIIFTLFFLIMIKMPLIGEDIALRTTNIYTNATISEIIDKIISQMSGWNARVGEQISIFFSSIDKSIFNLLNSILIVLYFYLFYVFCEGRLRITSYKNSFFILLLSFSLVFLCMPVIGEIFFWLTGSCNYFWACMIVLLFLLPYRLYFFNNKIEFSKKKQNFLILYTVFFGFFSGMSNENVSGTILVLLVILLLGRKIIFHKKNSVWSYTGFVSLVIGTISLLTAPSTAHRINVYNDIYNVGNVTFKTYISRLGNIVQSFFSSMPIIILFCITVILIFIWIFNRRIKRNLSSDDIKNTWISLLFLVVGILSLGALVLTPYVEKRSFLFFMTLWFMFVIRFLTNFFNKFDKLLLGVAISVFCLSLLQYKIVYSTYSNFTLEWKKIDTIIKGSYYSGKNEVVVESIKYGDQRILYYNGVDYIRTNPEYQRHFYGIIVVFQ